MYKRSVGIAILLAGCADLTYDPVERWRAEVRAVGTAEVSGQVAVEYDRGLDFEAAIALSGARRATYGWEIATGGCAAPGDRVGGLAAYRDVTTDSIVGTGSVTTAVNAPLSPGGTYHARVVDPENRTIVLACGDLLRVEVS